MSATRNLNPSLPPSTQRTLRVTLAVLVMLAPFASGQTASAPEPQTNLFAANLKPELPDAPGFAASSSTATEAENPGAPQAAAPSSKLMKHSAHLQMTVYPTEIADPMSVRDKIVGGLKDSVSLFSAAGWLGAAGWEQLTNGSPNYGTDSGAFGERLGAATIRGISEGVLSESFFAPILHEDPRYYIMGSGHNFFKRAIYAGTRVLITRTDSGRSTPNFSLILGNAAGSALTIPYYPSKNTTFSEVAQTFGGSIGGSAVGFIVDEFIVDALIDLHLKKRDPQP
ncbi:MAG: hypothetical protein WDN23_07250 [Edaphobacter sp.]